MSKGLERKSEHYSYPQISYYDRPIQTFIYEGLEVAYCRWESGCRLISVDRVPHYQLGNADFCFFLDLVSSLED